MCFASKIKTSNRCFSRFSHPSAGHRIHPAPWSPTSFGHGFSPSFSPCAPECGTGGRSWDIGVSVFVKIKAVCVVRLHGGQLQVDHRQRVITASWWIQTESHVSYFPGLFLFALSASRSRVSEPRALLWGHGSLSHGLARAYAHTYSHTDTVY